MNVAPVSRCRSSDRPCCDFPLLPPQDLETTLLQVLLSCICLPVSLFRHFFLFSLSLMPVSDTTYRSSRPSIPSPLSTPSYTASSLASSASPSWPGAATSQKRPPPIDTRSRGNTTPSSAGHTTFFSDSSNPSSPEEESPRCVTNDTAAQCRILRPLRFFPYISGKSKGRQKNESGKGEGRKKKKRPLHQQ